ncbi:MAG: menH 1 [Frankiales bacterium]|nr:menH 1 [Frankiales bacterium]
MGLVLVHGGHHDARCWGPTVAELQRTSPGLPVLAVDLPGRGSRPGNLMDYSVEGCARAVAEQVDAAGLDQVVLVAHSAAGMVVPAAAEVLGEQRVRRMVFVAASIPPEGGTILDTLAGPWRPVAARAARRTSAIQPPPRIFAAATFCNGMTREQRRFALDRLVPETPHLSVLPVSRAGLPGDIPRTWVLTGKDRSLRPAAQRASIERLGGVEEVVEIDTCHDAMISEPARLAEVLTRQVRAAARPPDAVH